MAAHFYGEGTIRHGTPGGEVMGLMVEPAWHGDALCREDHPGATWFPGKKDDLRPAKAVCGRCLVRAECLAVAMADRDLVGVWGGTSKRERDQMRRGAVA